MHEVLRPVTDRKQGGLWIGFFKSASWFPLCGWFPGGFRPSVLPQFTCAQQIACFERRDSEPVFPRNCYLIVLVTTTVPGFSCELET